MRIFRTKPFARFADKEGIDDAALVEAVRRAELGMFDADLGGGVIKQRIARQGQGKSGGFRSIMLFEPRTGRSSSTGSPRARGATSGPKSWRLSAGWLTNFWRLMMERSRPPLQTGRSWR